MVARARRYEYILCAKWNDFTNATSNRFFLFIIYPPAGMCAQQPNHFAFQIVQKLLQDKLTRGHSESGLKSIKKWIRTLISQIQSEAHVWKLRSSYNIWNIVKIFQKYFKDTEKPKFKNTLQALNAHSKQWIHTPSGEYTNWLCQQIHTTGGEYTLQAVNIHYRRWIHTTRGEYTLHAVNTHYERWIHTTSGEYTLQAVNTHFKRWIHTTGGEYTLQSVNTHYSRWIHTAIGEYTLQAVNTHYRRWMYTTGGEYTLQSVNTHCNRW
jgi:hypothetical protein